jgi:predicted nucleotidyltransferase
MIPRVERCLIEGIAVLDELELRYAVVGGLAVGVWSIPRATRDVDLYAELPFSTRNQLGSALAEHGFDVPAMADELQRFGVFRSKLKRERVFLDIFDATGPLGEAILERRIAIETAAGRFWFVSPEDLILLKAFSDRPRDQDDLVSLIAVPREGLDLAYVERWVKLLDESIGGNDVSERFVQAVREAERRKDELAR